MAQLCADLGDCFNFVKPGKGDLKIYDKSIPIQHLENETVMQEEKNYEITSNLEAIPNMKVCPILFILIACIDKIFVGCISKIFKSEISKKCCQIW